MASLCVCCSRLAPSLPLCDCCACIASALRLLAVATSLLRLGLLLLLDLGLLVARPLPSLALHLLVRHLALLQLLQGTSEGVGELVHQ